MRRLVSVVAAAAGMLGLAHTAEASAVLALKAGKDNSLAELKVGQYSPDGEAQVPFDQQRPLESWRVKGVALALRSDPQFECRRHEDVEQALSAANRREAQACLFAAELTFIIDKTRRYQVLAACAGWQDNVARCEFEREAGQFWVTRDAASAPKRFGLVLGPSKNDVRFPAAKSGPPYALRVKAASTPPKGRAQGAVWLTWPEKSLMLKFAR